MRYLDFRGEKGIERFEVIYDGILGTGRGYEAPSETRVIGSILDKLEAIGYADTRGDMATFSRKKEESDKLAVALEEAEFELLKATLAHTRWLARVVRKATAALDWFHAAPSTNPVTEVMPVDTSK